MTVLNTERKILPGLLETLENYLTEDQLLNFIERQYPNNIKGDLALDKEHLNNTGEIARDEIRRQLDGIITFCDSNLSREKHLLLLNNLGRFALERGEFTTAKNIYNKILRITAKKDNLENITAYSLLSLGDIYNKEAQWEKSAKYINKAGKLFQKHKDMKGLAKCENLYGAIQLSQGKIDKSTAHFEKGLSHLSHKRDKSVLAMVEGNMGTVNSIQGNFDVAYTFYKRALIKFEESGNLKRVAEIRHNLGMLLTQKKCYNLALTEFDICLRVSINAGYLPTQGISYLGEAYIYAVQGQLELSKSLADKALTISNMLNDRLSVAEIYKVYGIVDRKLKLYPTSEHNFLTSLRLNEELKNELNYAETAFELALLYREMGKEKPAGEYYKKSLSYYKRIRAVNEVDELRSIFNNTN